MAKYIVDIAPDHQHKFLAKAHHAGNYISCAFGDTPEMAKEKLIEHIKKLVEKHEQTTTEIVEIPEC